MVQVLLKPMLKQNSCCAPRLSLTVSCYKVVDSQTSFTPKIWEAKSWSRTFYLQLYNPSSNYCELCPWPFICKVFFKAVCKLVSLSCMVFPQVLFMSRRLRYLLRMCSARLKPCSAICVVGNVSSNKTLTFPQTSGKCSLHLIQKFDHPC